MKKSSILGILFLTCVLCVTSCSDDNSTSLKDDMKDFCIQQLTCDELDYGDSFTSEDIDECVQYTTVDYNVHNVYGNCEDIARNLYRCETKTPCSIINSGNEESYCTDERNAFAACNERDSNE